MLADKQNWKTQMAMIICCFSKMNTFNWLNPSQFYDWTFWFNDQEQGNTAYNYDCLQSAKTGCGSRALANLIILLMIRFVHKNDGQQWQTQEVHEDGFRNLSGFIKNHSRIFCHTLRQCWNTHKKWTTWEPTWYVVCTSQNHLSVFVVFFFG